MIRSTTPASEMVINLDGPDGNAFCLIALAKKLAHWKGDRSSGIISEMTGGGDYIELIKVFDSYFGDFVVLETSNQEILKIISSNA